jgi:hypothetical protein
MNFFLDNEFSLFLFLFRGGKSFGEVLLQFEKIEDCLASVGVKGYEYRGGKLKVLLLKCGN